MTTDLKIFKNQVSNAILVGTRSYQYQISEEERAKKALQKFYQDEADRILATIPKMCEKAAANGKNSAVVTQIKDHAFFRVDFVNEMTSKTIVIDGPGVYIINACLNIGLNVEVRGESLVEIIVSW